MSNPLSRRDVLRSAAVLAGAGTAAPAVRAAEPQSDAGSSPSGYRLGLVTYNLGRRWDVPTLIRMCGKAGYEAVELRTTHAHGVEPSLSIEQRAAVKKQFEDSPVELFGLGTTCEFHSPDQSVVRKQIGTCREFVKLAVDVGAKGVKVRPNGLPKGVETARTLEQIGEAVGECARFGADRGILIYVEVHGRGTSHPPHMHTIMQHADHPNATVCWNCNHSDIKGGSIKEHFGLLRPKLSHVHMHELTDRRYPYREFFGLLRSTGYAGYTFAEAGESKDPERVMRYYRALWEALQYGT